MSNAASSLCPFTGDAAAIADDRTDQLVLIGIDDTDNLESPGTGFHARQLARRITFEAEASVLDVTRHQLLFDRRIPYTSHNSSLCLRVRTDGGSIEPLADLCRDYLRRHSAEGSDAGLCVVPWNGIGPEVREFGLSAKQVILTLSQAEQLAERFSIVLEGITGDHGGKIGALAAVGLRRSGADGRLAWSPGLRRMSGVFNVSDLLNHTPITEVRAIGGHRPVRADDRVDVRPWPRAVFEDGKVVLLVQKAGSIHDHFDWQLASKDIIRRY